MSIRTEQVFDALRHVEDPDLKKDLVSLGMIKDVVVDGLKVNFTVVLTTPACPLKEKIKQDCIKAIHKYVHPGAVVTPFMTSNVTGQPKSAALSKVKNVIAVVSGKGGVGKSTIAANLAVSLAKTGAKVALCDADIYGPSIPIMFGLEGKQPFVRKVGEKDMMVPFEKFGVLLNSIGFLVPPEHALVWRGPMASKAMQQLVFDTDWGELDYMVVDMPPGTGDMHLTLVQHMSVSGVVVVTTPQKVALADARKGAEMFRTPSVNVPLLGIVENMAYFVPEDMPDRKYFIFGEGGGERFATELKVPLLGQVPIVERVRESGDAGVPPASEPGTLLGKSFMEIAERVAQQLAIANAGFASQKQVEITQ